MRLFCWLYFPMQTSNKDNNNSRVTFTQACSFICAIVIALFVISCDNSGGRTEGSKVLKSELGWTDRGPLPGLRIHSILSDKQVLLTGDAWMGLPIRDYDLKMITRSESSPVLLLEGKGSVGDPVILVSYIERQELESGEIRYFKRHHFGIKSTRFKEEP